jgi:ATP/maltotriose-dependent transcriptional regulator MalT
LRALARDAQGDPSQAEATLIQALDLARPGNFIRVFVDLGKPMQAMLHRLANQRYSVESVNRLLDAFPRDGRTLESPESTAQPRRSASPTIPALVEPLTHRELEVLVLLRGPQSIKEIAQKLNMAYSTAKRHTINIYAKLGVNQRWHAVARAEELNILPPK